MTATDQRVAQRRDEDGRHPLLTLTVVVALLGVVAAGAWGLSGRERVDTVTIGEAIDIPGGQMMVAELRPEIMVHNMAPGMTMPDPIPDGYRRFAVDLLFLGGEGGTTVYPGDVYVEGVGLEPTFPHRVSGTVSPLAEGSRLTLGVLFQVPDDVDSLWLGYRGGERVVVLEGDLGGHDHGDGSESVVDADPEVVISIDDGAFQQRSVTVTAGTIVGWENLDDGIPHTVTFSEGGPDSGVMQPGDAFSVPLEFAGSYSYFCKIHPSMRGVIVVEDG